MLRTTMAVIMAVGVVLSLGCADRNIRLGTNAMAPQIRSNIAEQRYSATLREAWIVMTELADSLALNHVKVEFHEDERRGVIISWNEEGKAIHFRVREILKGLVRITVRVGRHDIPENRREAYRILALIPLDPFDPEETR